MARKPAIWRYDPVQRAALLREGEQYPTVHDVAQRPTSHVGTDARGQLGLLSLAVTRARHRLTMTT